MNCFEHDSVVGPSQKGGFSSELFRSICLGEFCSWGAASDGMLLLRSCFLSVVLTAFAGVAVCYAEKEQNLVDKFEKKTCMASNGLTLGYRLLSPPEISDQKSYPLVIFLHGAGERGNDNHKQLVHVAQELATDAMQSRHPCFVVAPQCPEGKRWVEVDWGLDQHAMPKVPSEPLAATFELLKQLQEELPIDTDRVYICGLSMGGFGTWDALQRHSDLFAAAIPICGGGDVAMVEAIGDVPIWVFHGDADGAVKVKRSRDMVTALKAKGSPVIYTEYPGVGHNSWAMTAENRLVWDWLFAHKRAGE